MCLFAFCQLILFAKVQDVSIISLYLLFIIYTVIYLASPNVSIFAFWQLILFAKVQEVSIISLYLLLIIYTVIYLASFNAPIRFLPTHFICKSPGSFHNFIIPISYYLLCKLAYFTQCVYSLFANSFYLQSSRKLPLFHYTYKLLFTV